VQGQDFQGEVLLVPVTIRLPFHRFDFVAITSLLRTCGGEGTGTLLVGKGDGGLLKPVGDSVFGTSEFAAFWPISRVSFAMSPCCKNISGSSGHGSVCDVSLSRIFRHPALYSC